MNAQEFDAKRLMDLGERLASLRKKKGYTQLGLSLKAHVSKSFLSDLERGVRNPSYLTLCRLADALEVDVSEFFVKAN